MIHLPRGHARKRCLVWSWQSPLNGPEQLQQRGCEVSLGEFHQRAKTRARSLRIDLRDDLSAMPVSSERSCGRAQPRMVPTLVDLVVVDAHRIRALPAPRESEQGESLDLLRDTLAHTIRENPDISMEGLPRKSSAPPITLGPAIVHR